MRQGETVTSIHLLRCRRGVPGRHSRMPIWASHAEHVMAQRGTLGEAGRCIRGDTKGHFDRKVFRPETVSCSRSQLLSPPPRQWAACCLPPRQRPRRIVQVVTLEPHEELAMRALLAATAEVEQQLAAWAA